MMDMFPEEHAGLPFESYDQYTEMLFACVDMMLVRYTANMMDLLLSGEGEYKNPLYPDVELAYKFCSNRLAGFTQYSETETSGLPDDLDDLLNGFSESVHYEEAEFNLEAALEYIENRAALTNTESIPMPLYSLCNRLSLSRFSVFCLTAAVLSSTQTNYAMVYQIVNQDSTLSAPTVESLARVYHGREFSITSAYGEMSEVLEQLAPALDMTVNTVMPFATALSPDKHLIDYLFRPSKGGVDDDYKRFLSILTDEAELHKPLANQNQIDALDISYGDGTRIFGLYGDEGSGRRFMVRHFCRSRNIEALTIDCGKLYMYDFDFVNKALWAAGRECLMRSACCCLINLSYREDEKDKFLGYMDLALGKLLELKLAVFAISQDKLPLREITDCDFTVLELPTPNNQEREDCWRFFAAGYDLSGDVDLSEMATKFLFTPGKIKNALRMSKSLAAMEKYIDIPRSKLFEACYNQMSHELTQKATKIKATYTWDDIVMSKDQRQALEYACDQMRYRKQVYEQWDYNRKYPYGRGLSVLLFGAPGTGKSMCAQVLANALNLELYRVDLSKVIDKYVGETEKSISMIFREAKKCNVVLFFDECDTLFAKRSSDEGSQGQASANNNKTALLLQEVEAYDGVSVLATNYKHNIDPAFFRRMKFIVEFQFPDPQTRYILWKTTIPKDTPLAEDVDIQFLADRFEFVGGNIKNCILNAAFLAAGDGDGKQVHMRHYLQAIRYEFVKTGKVFTRADFEPYAHLVQ